MCRSIILHLFQSSSVGFGDGIFVDYCCCYYSQRSNSSSFRRESQAKKMIVLLPPACRQKKKKTAELLRRLFTLFHSTRACVSIIILVEKFISSPKFLSSDKSPPCEFSSRTSSSSLCSSPNALSLSLSHKTLLVWIKRSA